MSKVPKPTPEQVEKARQAAADKAAAAAKARTEQVAKDQKWLDDKTSNMSEEDKRELFNQISGDCKGTTQTDGKIIVACPLPRKLQYCVCPDKFECPNGHVSTGVGCKLSSATSAALKTDTIAIDGSFVSAEEGGSYLSPYVPWGQINGKCKTDGEPTLTHGNSAGVTIGTGVDLGAQKDPDAYLKRLEKAGVSQATRDTLKPLLGKQKAEACEALRTAKANGPIVLPQSDVELIDADAMKSWVPTLQGEFAKLGAARSANLRAMIVSVPASHLSPSQRS